MTGIIVIAYGYACQSIQYLVYALIGFILERI